MKVRGVVRPPGDKSVTHRALLMAALARGTSRLRRPLDAGDTRSMASALRSLGVSLPALRATSGVVIEGQGPRGLQKPTGVLDCGNSGTAARLLMGALAGAGVEATLSGDASLRARPMDRVTGPLSEMGAVFNPEAATALPIEIRAPVARGIDFHSPRASAQVKSCILFAGLAGRVPVTVREPVRSRDHTERLLEGLGAPVSVEGTVVTLGPDSDLRGFELTIPGDASSAAFLVGLALLAGSGELMVEGVGLNPTRVGYLRVLERMGARVEVETTGSELNEPVGRLVVRPSVLNGTVVEGHEIPAVIDEVPMLAVLATAAEGPSVFLDVGELRVKESNRLEMLAANLRAVGGRAEVDGDTLTVQRGAFSGGVVETAGDHRLAMAFGVLDAATGIDIRLSERESPAISYPGFWADVKRVVA